MMEEWLKVMFFASEDGLVDMEKLANSKSGLIDHGFNQKHVRFIVKHTITLLKTIFSPEGRHRTPCNWYAYADVVDEALRELGYVHASHKPDDERGRRSATTTVRLHQTSSVGEPQMRTPGGTAAARGATLPPQPRYRETAAAMVPDLEKLLRQPDAAIAVARTLLDMEAVRQRIVVQILSAPETVRLLNVCLGQATVLRQTKATFKSTVVTSLRKLYISATGGATPPTQWMPHLHNCKHAAIQDFYNAHSKCPRPASYTVKFASGTASAGAPPKEMFEHLLSQRTTVELYARRLDVLSDLELLSHSPDDDTLDSIVHAWIDGGHASDRHGGVKEVALAVRFWLPGASRMLHASGHVFFVMDGKETPATIKAHINDYVDALKEALTGQVFDVPLLKEYAPTDGRPWRSKVRVTEVKFLVDGALWAHCGIVPFAGASTLPPYFGTMCTVEEVVHGMFGSDMNSVPHDDDGGSDPTELPREFVGIPSCNSRDVRDAEAWAKAEQALHDLCGKRGEDAYEGRLIPWELVYESLHAFATSFKGAELRTLAHLLSDRKLLSRFLAQLKQWKVYVSVFSLHNSRPRVNAVRFFNPPPCP